MFVLGGVVVVSGLVLIAAAAWLEWREATRAFELAEKAQQAAKDASLALPKNSQEAGFATVPLDTFLKAILDVIKELKTLKGAPFLCATGLVLVALGGSGMYLAQEATKSKLPGSTSPGSSSPGATPPKASDVGLRVIELGSAKVSAATLPPPSVKDPKRIECETDLKLAFCDKPPDGARVDFEREYLLLFKWDAKDGDRLAYTLNTVNGVRTGQAKVEQAKTPAQESSPRYELIAVGAKWTWPAGK